MALYLGIDCWHAGPDRDRHRDRRRHPPHRLQSIAELRSRLPRIRHDRRSDPRRRRGRGVRVAGDVGRCARSHAGAAGAHQRRSTSRTFAPSPARRNSTAASTSIAARPTSGETLDPSQPLAPQLQGMFSRDRSPVWMDATTAVQCREIDAALGGAERTKALTGSPACERFTGPQIRKFFQQQPDAYARDRAHSSRQLVSGVAAHRRRRADRSGRRIRHEPDGPRAQSLVARSARRHRARTCGGGCRRFAPSWEIVGTARRRTGRSATRCPRRRSWRGPATTRRA